MGKPEVIVLEVSERELGELLKLLQEHLDYGWIALGGEFEVVATGERSESLRQLYRRLRPLRGQRAQLQGVRAW